MNYQVGKPGRMVVARLEEGDPVYESIETICSDETIKSAVFWVIGGVKNVAVVTGPIDQDARPISVVTERLENVQEILGSGTVFPNGEDLPKVHMHASLGHDSHTVTGCPRVNLDSWLITEIVIQEITGIEAKRLKNSSGYELLTMMGSK